MLYAGAALRRVPWTLVDTIKDTINDVIRSLEPKKNGSRGDNPYQWMQEVFSKKELKHIEYDYFHKGILGIIVDSSTWLYHLSLKKEALLLQLNKKDALVKNIRFRLGGVK